MGPQPPIHCRPIESPSSERPSARGLHSLALPNDAAGCLFFGQRQVFMTLEYHPISHWNKTIIRYQAELAWGVQ